MAVRRASFVIKKKEAIGFGLVFITRGSHVIKIMYNIYQDPLKIRKQNLTKSHVTTPRFIYYLR